MANRILIVEDEEKLARMVELELTYEGYQVEKALDGRTGLERALSGEHDLILLEFCSLASTVWKSCAATGRMAGVLPSSCSRHGTR